MYGSGSDPIKTSEWIVLQRLHAACLNDTTCDSSSGDFKNFTRLLLKGPSLHHTRSVHLAVVAPSSAVVYRGGGHR